jgi:hypothetical protein
LKTAASITFLFWNHNCIGKYDFGGFGIESLTIIDRKRGKIMATAKAVKRETPRLVGTAAGCADHDYDLIQDLGHRLDALWHYDQHISNAKGHAEIQSYWSSVKKQDEENVRKLKQLIGQEIKIGCF